MTVPKTADEPNLARILNFLRRRGPWILLCAILAAGAAYALSQSQQKEYTAKAAVIFSSDQLSPAIAGLPALSAEGNALLRQSNNLELLYLGNAAEKTAEAVGHGLTGEDIGNNLKVQGEPESSIATISVTNPSPELAARIANVYAAKAVAQLEEGNQGYYRSALKLVERQLHKLPFDRREGLAGQTLQNRMQSLELLASLKPNSVQIAEQAAVPQQPSSPHTKRNVAIGLLLGLLLGLGVALAMERLDRRVKGVEELRSIFGYPLLGAIPESSTIATFASLGGSQPGLLTNRDVESLQLVRAHLRSLHPDRPIRTVLVTSAAAGEGKATIAVNLAAAAGLSGARVLLLDANLRRAGAVNGGEDRGSLPEVLRRGLALRYGARPMWAQQASEPATPPDIVPAGPTASPEAVALLESEAMKTLIEEARSSYDLTLINAPSLGEAPDAFALLLQVDAVIVVGRLKQATHEDARRLAQILEDTSAPVGGIVVNGERARKGASTDGADPVPAVVPSAENYASSA